ncbi:uncharacterized protein LOC114542281 [Dendronephthya gigantea]|uniref:uncharacterized protein LOC114542281 n=1 Tax=Dendronephthya gigantea TaxID=151771 RepID=UPI00106DAFFE|nr:uncharacterized protein LOC114542281 [Dendronephthya gigantea]
MKTEKKNKKQVEPVGHNFEAVVTFKEYCDKRDNFYVYKVNDKRGNPDKPSFVFKTSKEKANMALAMDRDGEHFLNEEYCFFDGQHKRCRGFVTLTASVYNPLSRKQVSLAVMEAENEDTQNIALFWNLFNEVLRKVSRNNNARFNPTGWCTDMAGANLAGLSEVYGNDVRQRIKSCEFHFKDHRNKNPRKLRPEDAEEFKPLCEELLEAATEAQYNKTKMRLDSFISGKEEHKFLATWLAWWHDRRGFIFRAFAPKGAPFMNQAEVIHAGWSNRGISDNMSLLEACLADVGDAVQLDVEIKAFAAGTAIGGSGPSYMERKQKTYTREIDLAKQFGSKMICNRNVYDGRKVDPNSSFKPNEKRKSGKNPPSKNRKRKKTVTTTELVENTSTRVPINSPLIGERPCSSTTEVERINSVFEATKIQQIRSYTTPVQHTSFPNNASGITDNAMNTTFGQPAHQAIFSHIITLVH